MAGSGANRSSGEWAAPVTQGQFDGFAGEVRTFMGEQRTQNGVIMSMLGEGQSTMAVLRRDTAEYRTKSDEASSKIRLLTQNEAIRADREKRDETVALPALPPPKPTFWQNATDELSKKFISALAVVILIVAYQELRSFVIAHPSLTGDGEGFTSPLKDHHGNRELPQAVPVSAPSNAANPLGPAKP
jgi:hypothetical protein